MRAAPCCQMSLGMTDVRPLSLALMMALSMIAVTSASMRGYTAALTLMPLDFA